MKAPEVVEVEETENRFFPTPPLRTPMIIRGHAQLPGPRVHVLFGLVQCRRRAIFTTNFAKFPQGGLKNLFSAGIFAKFNNPLGTTLEYMPRN